MHFVNFAMHDIGQNDELTMASPLGIPFVHRSKKHISASATLSISFYVTVIVYLSALDPKEGKGQKKTKKLHVYKPISYGSSSNHNTDILPAHQCKSSTQPDTQSLTFDLAHS